MQKKLTIAMMTNNYLPFIGGVPISIQRLSDSLRRKGHTVYIFAPVPVGGIGEQRDPNVISIKLLMLYRDRNLKFGLVNAFSPKIEREFKARDFDIIHVHHPFWMGGKGLRLGKKYGVPVVLTFHTRFDNYGHYIPFLRGFFKNVISHRMIRGFSNRCEVVFAPAKTSKEYLESIGVNVPVTVLPTGVEFESYQEIGDKLPAEVRAKYGGEILLCSVSRLTVEKNIMFLIDGLERVRGLTDIPFKCLIIGEGPERSRVQEAIDSRGLGDAVYLAGDVPPGEMPGYYMASDLFVFASKSETQGLVLLEAMAGGCPVVAVSATGVDDTVIDGYNGYSTPENAAEWAERVYQLIGNREKLAEMSGNARSYAASFSADEMAGRAGGVYQEVVANGGGHNV